MQPWTSIQCLRSLLKAVLAAGLIIAAAELKPGCESHCGNISIPYPFGLTNACSLNEKFRITCDTSVSPPKALFYTNNYPVLDILLDGQLRVLYHVSYDCNKSSSTRALLKSPDSPRLYQFPISNTKNMLTAVGCNADALVWSWPDEVPLAECSSLCIAKDAVTNGECTGNGCCQGSIPRNVTGHVIDVSLVNTTDVPQFYPCSYSFISENGAYSFSSSDLDSNLRNITDFPVVLDWSIGNQTCNQAKENLKTYACKENSNCIDSENGPGYTCHCSEGFQGNPYVGCLDINECETLSPCNGTCFNVPGSYKCSCPVGYEGDGWKNGTGCSLRLVRAKHQFQWFFLIIIVLGTSIGLLVLLLGISWLFLAKRQRKLDELKRKFFQQNGGSLLEQELSKHERAAKIFTAAELGKATNNFHEGNILGQGGQGTVYKGVLQDNRVVAIKKAKIVDQSQVQKFINEVIVLSQINQKNVVKLLGCCLETEVPLLVYEFVPNGTLFDHLLGISAALISWETRLKIATETAGALAYLHYSAAIPIIHRDIKLTNILLDNNFTVKVSDFGASRLVPSDQEQLTTLLQGTLGYLDPEYLHTHQLTEKSDVYSFGVVLVELITGKKALSFHRQEEERNLAMHFVSVMKQNRLVDILDHRVLNDSNIEQVKAVASIARRCVREKGEERPSMKEVAIELEGLRAILDQTRPLVTGDCSSEEEECLMARLSDMYSEGAYIARNSLVSQASFEIEGGR